MKLERHSKDIQWRRATIRALPMPEMEREKKAIESKLYNQMTKLSIFKVSCSKRETIFSNTGKKTCGNIIQSNKLKLSFQCFFFFAIFSYPFPSKAHILSQFLCDKKRWECQTLHNVRPRLGSLKKFHRCALFILHTANKVLRNLELVKVCPSMSMMYD